MAKTNAAVFQVIVVSKNAALIRYYERRGYRRTGSREPYPVELNVGLPIVDGIDMVVLQKHTEQ